MSKGYVSNLTVVALAVAACTSAGEPDNLSPSGSFIRPVGDATLYRGDTIHIEFQVEDLGGSVSHVRFYVDGRPVALDSTSPYTHTWYTDTVTVGEHRVRAGVWDHRGANQAFEIGISLRWRYQVPRALGDGWHVGSAEDEGLDLTALRVLLDSLYLDPYWFMHSLLIVRNGRLVLEEYFNGFTRDSLNNLQSTSKSFTSTLIGIAIDRGEISGVDVPLFDLLPPEYDQFRTAAKEDILLWHVLNMSPGLEWNEGSTPTLGAENDNIIGNTSPDYVAYSLGKPVVANPGTGWWYHSGCTMMLGAILRNVAGVDADIYAERHLFGPLGITTYLWSSSQYGELYVHGGLWLRARDLARLGQLFLRQGMWDGEQVVSSQWVAEATQPRITAYGDVQYGYQWWYQLMQGFEVPYTSGFGGQHVFLVPDLDMAVITTAHYRSQTGQQRWMIENIPREHVIPAALPAAPN
jgi:CubicO group peptidase (beta-lactamase class C family)